MEVVGGLAVIVVNINSARGGAWSSTTIRGLNISETSHLAELSTLTVPLQMTSIALHENYVYLGMDMEAHIGFPSLGVPRSPDGMLALLDVSDPATPVWAGGFYNGGFSMAVSVEGEHAIVADGVGGLRVFDVSGQGSPNLIGEFRFQDFNGNNYLFTSLNLVESNAYVDFKTYGDDFLLSEGRLLSTSVIQATLSWSISALIRQMALCLKRMDS